VISPGSDRCLSTKRSPPDCSIQPIDPLASDTAEYASCEQKVRDHLGPQSFFSRDEPDRLTVVPDWDG
jgi:hypothetical protein